MNLSEAKNRDVAQLKQLSRRSSIIPETRNTRAPEYQGAADLRSARRGDGGAQELMRTLGMVQNAATDFQQYAQNAHAAREQDNIAQGAADQQTGNVDPEMLEKSDGYRNAVTKGRTMSFFDDATQEFAPELEGLIEAQTDPSIDVRRAEVKDRIERFYHEFSLDPETGEFKEFLASPDARRYLANAIGSTRGQFESAALRRIEERFERESFGHFDKNIVSQGRTGAGVDLNVARSLLPPSAKAEDIADNTITAIFNAADALHADGRSAEASALLAGLRGYLNKPIDAGVPAAAPTGTPEASTLAPQETAALYTNPVGGGTITSRMGASRGNRTHNGVDIAVPIATPVRSAMGGEVLRVWTASDGGLSVKVKYDDGTIVGFAHLSEAGLTKGQRVNAGDVLAKTGNSGRSTGPHLHYTMTRNGQKVNPLEAAPGEVVSAAPSTTAPAPTYRLTNPHDDPITAAEKAGQIAPIVGLEGMVFTPEQRAKINQAYSQTTDAMRREWKAAQAETQSDNAANLALGLLGVGGKRTTKQDVLTAHQSGAIDTDGALTLFRIVEANEDRAANAIDRAEARADRQEIRRNRAIGEAVVGKLVGDLTSGKINAAGMRTAIVATLPHLPPAVQADVLSSGLSIANGYESAITNNEAARRHMGGFEEAAASSASTVIGWQVTPGNRPAAGQLWEQAIDEGKAEYLRRVIAGEDPNKVDTEVSEKLGRKAAALQQKYGPLRN